MRLILILRYAILFSIWLPAQTGLFPVTDVFSRSMGSTGLAREGAASLWTNPAGLGYMQYGLAANATTERRFGIEELSISNLGVAHKSGFGMQLAHFSFSGYGETRIGLAYGRKLGQNFSVGGELNAFSTAAQGYENRLEVAAGLGCHLRLSDQISLGARLFNPSGVGEIPQVLAIGGVYRPSDKVSLATELHQDSSHPLRARFGLEYLPTELVSVRMGLQTGDSELSFGLAYRVWQGMDLGISTTYHRVLGLSPALGLAYAAPR